MKHSLQWVESVGPVYELPDSLKPEVFPWLAMHIWYDKHVMNHPDRIHKIMDLYYDDNQAYIENNFAEESFHISAFNDFSSVIGGLGAALWVVLVVDTSGTFLKTNLS